MKVRLLALFLLVAPTLFAQVRESVTVEVVDVPVYVYNANGPVRDLTKDDFELFVNGKRQQIDYFDKIDFVESQSQQQPSVTATRDPRERRLFLLLFDLLFTRSAAIDRARKAAVAMIDHAGPADYFAVATLTYDKGAQFVTPFTNDRVVARRAAMTLSDSSSRDPLMLAISPSERRTFMIEGAGPQDGEVILDPGISGITKTNADLENRMMPVKRLIADQIEGFDMIGTRLAQLEGYKHVILLSEGFNPHLVYSNPYATDPAMVRSMNAMYAAFRRSNVLVDAIDLGHVERDTFLNDAVRMIAQETGGQFIVHENDLKRALTQISTASGYGYRLGFTMPPNAKKGDNAIDVRLRNAPRGTTLSFRRGFSTTKITPSALDGLRLADILLNDIPQNGVPPRVAFREKAYLEIDVPSDAFGNGAVDLLLYIFDANGAVVDFKQKRVPSAGVVRTKLELQSGTYVAKAILRAGDSVGFTRQQFVIP